MKTLAFIGFGALGRQMLGLMGERCAPGRVVRFDDGLQGKGAEESFPFEAFLDAKFADAEFFVALGYRHLPLKAEILRRLRAAGRRVPAWVHPSCQVAPTARLGDGSFLFPLCNVDQEAECGAGVLLHNSVVVSHGARIGDAAYLSPGVVLSGQVTIGEAAFLGSGTVVANGRTIGARARVGLASAVTRDLPDGASAIGNPLRLLERPLELE